MDRLTRRPQAGAGSRSSGLLRLRRASLNVGGSTTAAPARGLRWVLALIAAVLAVVSGQLGAIPASAALAAYTYDTAAYTYNASANLSIANATAAAVRSPPLAQEAVSWVRPVSTGRFGVAANTASEVAAAAPRVVHGNSASSPATAYLYRLSSAETGYLKTGISQNPMTRYSQTFMQDKTMEILQSGTRREMLNLERFIVERDPGPLNFERWAGQFAGDVP